MDARPVGDDGEAGLPEGTGRTRVLMDRPPTARRSRSDGADDVAVTCRWDMLPVRSLELTDGRVPSPADRAMEDGDVVEVFIDPVGSYRRT